jgi:predicted Rossmann-fold nucleotide-binding protein
MKVGIIGSKNYQNVRRIKEILMNLKQRFGQDVTIVSGGTTMGAEKAVRKFALEFGLNYLEFNPAHTVHNLYSAMPEDYYSKVYHGSQYFHRYMMMGRYCDSLIVLLETKSEASFYKTAVDAMQKRGKKTVVML